MARAKAMAESMQTVRDMAGSRGALWSVKRSIRPAARGEPQKNGTNFCASV